VASRSFGTLEQSCLSALTALRVKGSRNCVIVLDETVFHPQFEVIVGLRPDSCMGFIGGYKASDEDYSYIPSPADDEQMSPDRLAKMTIHYVMSRADSNKHTYQLDMLPRKPKPKGSTETMAGAQQTLREFGFLWKVVTWANSDLPPIAGAWDGGTCNTSINALFLGLLPKTEMQVPFFNQCKKKRLDEVPMWSYQAVFYDKHFLSGCTDCRHAMKRFGAHLWSGARVIRWGAFVINLSPLVSNGLPLRALSGDDPQSDVDGAKRLNAAYIGDSWGALPCVIPQFICGLLTSAWTASSAFSLRHGLANALLGYYLLCTQAAQSWKEHKGAWTKHFLPIQCLRTMFDLAGHIVLASVHWPQEVPWVPRAREESLIEKFFGQLKSFSRGNCTVKDAVYGAQMVHAKQYQKSSMWEAFDARKEVPVTGEELAQIARDALTNAVLFQAWISNGKSTSEISADVQTWWKEYGENFIKKRGSGSQDNTDDPQEDSGLVDDQLVDDLFEEDYLDDCDLEECEHYEDTPEQDPEVLEDTPENLLQVLEDRQSLIVNLQKVMAEQPEELPGALPETSKDVDDQDDAPLPVKAVGSFEDILAAVGKSPHFCESSKTFATGCMQRLRDLVGSKTQVQGVRTNENMYNILTSQLCRARQFNRHTAARGGRMYNWFAAQQSLVEKVADEPGDGPQAVLSSSVFRPICSKEPQLLLVKDIQGGIMRFEVMVCFSVFRGAVAREPGASRRLRVTKNLGINAPAEAVARILVLYLEWVPPNKETCTVQR
ncbi:Uncharacterized protein SCF082_LOCUS4965, partial [Durusdinium trenchii]